MKGKIAIHVSTEHRCGQVHEIVYHVRDAKFDVYGIQFPDFTKAFPAHDELENSIEFSGRYGKVDINGVEVKGNRILCKGCGVDLMCDLAIEEDDSVD
jgi:hypothetical protein